jgi:hypothetical protein
MESASQVQVVTDAGMESVAEYLDFVNVFP